MSMDRIDRVAPDQVRVGGDDIPIGRSYRREVGRVVDR